MANILLTPIEAVGIADRLSISPDSMRESARHSADVQPIDIRLEVHDASRFEWTVAIPLPEKNDAEYELVAELEVPANVFAQHVPWERLQSWTRLDRPTGALAPGEAVTTDELRRVAIGVAQRISRGGDRFARECRLAASLTNLTRHTHAASSEPSLARLRKILSDVCRRVVDARRSLDSAESGALTRERPLVDEYLSVRILEMLTASDKTLSLVENSEAGIELGKPLVELRATLNDAMLQELSHRNDSGYIKAAADSVTSVDAYVARASRLKKHFQEVLFLEPEIVEVAKRANHWGAAIAALTASTWAFGVQLLLLRGTLMEATVGSGLAVAAVAAGVVYATKDRLKEIGRNWISGKLQRIYAQRVARWRAPARMMPGRDVIVTARESFDQKLVQRPDPLNPDSGVGVPVTIIRFTHRGTVASSKVLSENGISRIKHVFRYDLSALLPRLDDAVKRIPVLENGVVRFAEAHKTYRVPVSVSVIGQGASVQRNACLILQKRGLERLEEDGDVDASC